MCEVAAVLAQAAVAYLMAAHVKLEVLLELADLGVLERGGADDVHQAPVRRRAQCWTRGRGFSPGTPMEEVGCHTVGSGASSTSLVPSSGLDEQRALDSTRYEAKGVDGGTSPWVPGSVFQSWSCTHT